MTNEVHTGTCIGGPLDNHAVVIRNPDGFLAADKTAGTAWLYKRGDDGNYHVCTDHDDSLIYPQGASTGLRNLQLDRATEAAALGQVDVIAVQSGGQ
jgi:hypothetical protein